MGLRRRYFAAPDTDPSTGPGRRNSRLNAVVTRTSSSPLVAAELRHPAACKRTAARRRSIAQPPNETSSRESPAHAPSPSGIHPQTERRPVVAAVPGGFARGGGDWAGAAERSEGRFAAEAVDVLSGRDEYGLAKLRVAVGMLLTLPRARVLGPSGRENQVKFQFQAASPCCVA
jgi:hypothetical protein